MGAYQVLLSVVIVDLGEKSNEMVLHTLLIFGTADSPLDAVNCHMQDILFFCGRVLNSCARDTSQVKQNKKCFYRFHICFSGHMAYHSYCW